MTATETWTIGRLLTWTTDYLKRSGSTSPRLDAEVLLAHARGCQRIELYTAFSEEPSEQTRAAFRELVRRRAEGTPVAYLAGFKEFYSMAFEVNPDVLIPRPETEHLVVEALDCAKLLLPKPAHSHPLAETVSGVDPTPTGEWEPEAALDVSPEGSSPEHEPSPLQIADVGTGSGAVAIAIARHLPQCRMTAIDISPSALDVARRNAQRHGLEKDRIQFVQGDLLSWCTPSHQFDMIVSNPPYVSPEEFQNLPKTVREFEPRSALVSEPDGGSVIGRLVSQAAPHTRPGGYLIFEFSPMLENRLAELITPAGHWSEPVITKDIGGHSRVVTLLRLESSFS